MPTPLPSLELLRMFEACGRYQGFTAAAASVGLRRGLLLRVTDSVFAACWRSV